MNETLRRPADLLVAFAVLMALLGGCSSSGSTSSSSPSTSNSSQSLSGLPVTALPNPPAAVTFYVSPSGNDSAPGTQQQPFQTVERAREAVRALPASAWTGDVVVQLAGGTYRLAQTLTLEGADSGQNGYNVVYRSAPGENAVLSGASQVTGWELSDPSLNIYRAYVGQVSSRQLYVNGERAVRARTPDYPAGFLPSFLWQKAQNGTYNPVRLGIEFIPTSLNPARWADPATWTNPQDVEAVILTQWKMMSVKVASVTPYPNYPINHTLQPLVLAANTGLLTMQEPGWTNSNVYIFRNLGVPLLWNFWQVTRFENAYEFLSEPGQWYLNQTTGYLYYIPRPGENMSTADVELPILETLVAGKGTAAQAVSHVSFEGLTFSGATWLLPSTGEGYVADQSGFILVGSNHQPNIWGHDQNVVRTPGNVRFCYANNISFIGNIFEHLGGVGLDFDTGSQDNQILQNLFIDISSSGLEVGGVSPSDARPPSAQATVSGNVIAGNLIRNVGREFVDVAGMFIGFNANVTVQNNTIAEVPWSGIAMGWGWGLLDEGGFPGNVGAVQGEWGNFTTPTINSGNRVLNNRIYSWGNQLWDTGAIYTTGQQGQSMQDALLMQGNVATNKRPSTGSNVFYTDGGTRFVTEQNNVSFDNPIGVTWLGPPWQLGDPLPYPPLWLGDCLSYGDEVGGCVTYGDINFISNFWERNNGYYNPCNDPPVVVDGVTYPVGLNFSGNQVITSLDQVPPSILQGAGVQSRPASISADRWQLPPAGPAAEQTVVTCPLIPLPSPTPSAPPGAYVP